MNIRTTKIVAPLVAMALCIPNIAIAQEESTKKTISGTTDINDSVSLTRSISAKNRNNSTPQDSKTIYVNPGDTIHVELDLKGKKDSGYHAFTSFQEVVSPIKAFSPSSGSRVVKKTPSAVPQETTLDNLNDGTFTQTDKSTIQFKVSKTNSVFGEVAHQVKINYSYTAANEPGEYQTQFKPDPKFAEGSKTFNANELDLTIVVKGKEENRPPRGEDDQATPPDQGDEPTPPDQNEQDTPPEQDEQAVPPKSKSGTGFSWLTKALGVLAFLGGTVWFIIKHIFRL
ncbi:membrane protein [Corynebacterium diphtheriae]|nr:membrane protein [Corynebacterium diphtheriae]